MVTASPENARLDKSKLLATLAGAGARGAANALLMGVVGLVLNVALLWLSWGALDGLTSDGGAGPGHGGGGGAGSALLVFAGLVLLPGFPIAWLMIGKKRGVESAVRHVARTYKAGLVELLVDRDHPAPAHARVGRPLQPQRTARHDE